MAATLTFRILGSGSSPGNPRIGNDWGRCDPKEPKNRRRRAALLVTRTAANGAITRLLVDIGPDLREQMLDAEVDWVDAVVVTHAHADHTHGIDDLRSFVLNRHHKVTIWMDAPTSERVRAAFAYCFETPAGSSYPPILDEHRITPGVPITVDGEGGPITFTPFRQMHGDIESLGLRFGRVAYSTDAVGFPDESLPFLEDLDVWIVDSLRRRPHPSHFSVDEALAWIARMRPGRAWLTHLHNDLDWATMIATLPAGVEPAWDGLEFQSVVE
ncbi:MBL fold metallo-hydrolase [Siculibacillus lacustris]|uniref:MBL fold metallo-hydrolase n=1 Tax=Siculibacillus lacustris TaxID=1549641 RepID=A0A4Q9VP82_9HYPH|nr:MBL fold metallo-hydrolase [Siculibacillus lacustris]TBW37007.1 MBL fold metallo-hydrolase [Siculibacillus lacustris]